MEGEPLTLGVQHLAVEALPVEVSVDTQEGHSVPLGCLLGSMPSGETALFMPPFPGVEHKTLRLAYRGHEIPIVLLERVDASPGFSAFRFDTPAQAEGHPGLAAPGRGTGRRCQRGGSLRRCVGRALTPR